MTYLTQQLATKGSQKWMQIIVNQKQDTINQQIQTCLGMAENEEINWRSPLATKNYAEYKDQEFLDALEIQPTKISLSDFWPKSGPRWDALAKSSSGKLILVEAKSHIPELISTCKASKTSMIKIQTSIEATKKRFGVKIDYDWTKPFYQYANRLAHVYFLRKNGFDAWLIDVYFINDTDMNGPKTIDEWKGAIRLLHRCLGLKENVLSKFVVDVFIDVAKIQEI